MLTLNNRKDGYRFLLPDEFIPEEINEKYAKILESRHSFFRRPIDFLNETIQGIQVLGVQDAVFVQNQPGYGNFSMTQDREEQNRFSHTASEYVYRSEKNPLNLVDKTLNVTFRQTLGYLNYFILFESFFWQYSRDEEYDKLPKQFFIDILNNKGAIYSRIVLDSPMIQAIDMIDLNFTSVTSQSEDFKVIFKYSNFDFEFLDDIDENQPVQEFEVYNRKK